jgi:hypothetical protein
VPFKAFNFFMSAPFRAIRLKAVQAAVSGVLPGPFAYAERWDDAAKAYRGIVIEKSLNVPVVVDSESVIIMPDVALAYVSAQAPVTPVGSPPGGSDGREKPTGGTTGQFRFRPERKARRREASNTLCGNGYDFLGEASS